MAPITSSSPASDGFENPSPLGYRVAVIPDQPPIVQVSRPVGTPRSALVRQFPMSIVATDDYGVHAMGGSSFVGSPEPRGGRRSRS